MTKRPFLLTGADLRTLRRAMDVTQDELAEIAGVCRQGVSYWEGQAVVKLEASGVSRILRPLGAVTLEAARVDLEFLSTLAASTPDSDDQPVRCGARTRQGAPCPRLAELGRMRCRYHGGSSTGPNTTEGKARIAEAQRRRWAAWRKEKADRQSAK